MRRRAKPRWHACNRSADKANLWMPVRAGQPRRFRRKYSNIRQLVLVSIRLDQGRRGRFHQGSFAMRNLNLDQLRTLVEVVECGSFSAAARRLNLTQPAVSMQIRELERRLDVRLIERIGKQAHPTAPCRELMAAAQGIFRECDLAHAAMRRFK